MPPFDLSRISLPNAFKWTGVSLCFFFSVSRFRAGDENGAGQWLAFAFSLAGISASLGQVKSKTESLERRAEQMVANQSVMKADLDNIRDNPALPGTPNGGNNGKT